MRAIEGINLKEILSEGNDTAVLYGIANSMLLDLHNVKFKLTIPLRESDGSIRRTLANTLNLIRKNNMYNLSQNDFEEELEEICREDNGGVASDYEIKSIKEHILRLITHADLIDRLVDSIYECELSDYGMNILLAFRTVERAMHEPRFAIDIDNDLNYFNYNGKDAFYIKVKDNISELKII